MKVSKEFKTGLVVVLSILLLIFGVNYLKGSSFFGGDDYYYAYFPTSGGLTASASVTMNGVEVGKVLSVDLVRPNQFIDKNKRVLVKFSILDNELKPALGSNVEIVPGLLSVAMNLDQHYIADGGFHKVGDTLTGSVSQDITEQVQTELIPVKQKLENLMESVDNIVVSINAFWDTSAAYSLDASLVEVKRAINTFGRVAENLDGLIDDERAKLDRIFTNVEVLTDSLNETIEQVNYITKNVGTITDSLKKADINGTIDAANLALDEFSTVLARVNSGEGTLGKLLADDQLYSKITDASDNLSILLEDLRQHPERYISVSVFGAKTKGAPLTKDEERKLKKFLDTLN